MMRCTRSITTVAAAAVFLSAVWHSDAPALASSGFLGTWCGWSMSAYTITDFPRLQVKQGMFTETDAHYNGSQLVAERWGQTGTLNSDGSKIVWSDGKAWTRTTNGARYCGSMAAVTAATAPTQAKYYRLFNQFTGSGKCLDVVNDGRNDKLILANCGNYTGQKWWAEEAGRGYFRLKNTFTGSGKCLDVVNDGRNDKLRLADCGNYTGQKWWGEDVGRGYVRLKNTFTGTGKCIDVVNDGRNNQLRLADCGNYTGQMWYFERR